MSENMDPAQQQLMEFFAMMLPGTKHQAPAPAEAEGTAPKYNKPNEKGGQGRGGGKGRDYKDSTEALATRNGIPGIGVRRMEMVAVAKDLPLLSSR